MATVCTLARAVWSLELDGPEFSVNGKNGAISESR